MRRNYGHILAGIAVAAILGLIFLKVQSKQETPSVASFSPSPQGDAHAATQGTKASSASPLSGEEASRTDPYASTKTWLEGNLSSAPGRGLADVDVFLCSVPQAVSLGIRNFPGVDGAQLDPAMKKTKTSGDGSFVIEGLEPGEYGFLAWTPDYLPFEKRVEIEAGENKLSLVAEGPGLTILGRTVSEDQKPVDGVQVIAIRGNYDQKQFDALSDWEKLRLQMFSEAEMSEVDGNFTLKGLPTGLFDVIALKDGFPMQIRYRVEAGSEGLVFVMTRAAKISGIVRDETGKPIPKPRVAAQNYFGAARFGDSGNAVGDENGRYELSAVKTGGISVDLFVEADGFARVQLPLAPFAAGDDRNLDVTLTKAAVTSGRVEDGRGSPVPGVSIFFGDAGKIAFGNLKSNHSGPDGEFSIPNTQKGKKYFVYLMKEGFEPKLCQPVPGGEENLILTLEPYTSLMARLVPEDGATEFAPFTAETFSEDEHAVRTLHQRQSFPAGNGEFRLPQVSPRSNGLQVWVPGYAPALIFDLQGQIRDFDGQPAVEVPLRKGKTVKGRVVDAKSGAGIGNANVQVVSKSRKGLPKTSGLISVETASDGTFSIEGAEAGISVRAEGYARHTHPLSAGDGERHVDLGEIPLSPSGSILVAASGPDGAPIPGMEVSYSVRGVSHVDAGFTDSDGNLLIENLEPGHYELSGWDWKSTFESGRPYAHSKWAEVKVGQSTSVRIEIHGGGTVSGKVEWGKLQDSLVAPEAAVYLLASSSLGNPEDQSSRYWAKVNGAGEYWIPHVPAGRYLATLKSFYLPQRHALSREVVVELGRETRLDFIALPSGLAGQALDAQSGKPVGTARIQIIPADGALDRPLIYTLADGQFGVIGIREGSYRLKASKEGFATEEFGPFVVAPDRVTEGIRFHMIPQGFLQVIAAGKTGNPIVGAKVHLLGASRELLADGQGAVIFDQLKPGPFQVEIQAAGYAKKTAGPAMVEAGKQKSLYVYLRKLCKLTVKVEGPGNAAAPGGTTLTLVDQETGQVWPGAVTLQEGVATIHELPEGSYKIQANGGSLMGNAVVEVFPGQENLTHLLLQ